jgi:hypothetical protein
MKVYANVVIFKLFVMIPLPQLRKNLIVCIYVNITRNNHCLLSLGVILCTAVFVITALGHTHTLVKGCGVCDRCDKDNKSSQIVRKLT